MTSTKSSTRDDRLSVARSIGILIAAGGGWFVGFYLGVFVVLSIVGFNDVEGWQFEFATVPLGAVGAALMATAASPDRGTALPRALWAGLMGAVVMTILLAVSGGDFAFVIVVGGLVVVTAIVAAIVTAPSDGA